LRLTDASTWNQNIHITSTNVLYTTSAGTSLKGVTFVPVQTPSITELIPPPILTGQAGVLNSSAQFAITPTPDDAPWRTGVSSITVNGGAPLPAGAYDLTQGGKIVFNLGAYQSYFQLSGVQGVGTNNIVITSPGYSTSSGVQYIAVAPTVTTGIASNVT